MGTTKLSASLPKGENNGLDAVARRFLSAGEEPVFAIVRLGGYRATTDIATGLVEPTCRILNIEPMTDPIDVERVHAIMRAAYSARTGLLELPFDEVEPDAPSERRPRLDPDELGERLRATYGPLDADDAETLKAAATEVVTAQYAGSDMIRGKLGIGPGAAALVLQQLGDLGVLGPPDGRPARAVLAHRAQLRSILAAIDAAAFVPDRESSGWPVIPAAPVELGDDDQPPTTDDGEST